MMRALFFIWGALKGIGGIYYDDKVIVMFIVQSRIVCGVVCRGVYWGQRDKKYPLFGYRVLVILLVQLRLCQL